MESMQWRSTGSASSPCGGDVSTGVARGLLGLQADGADHLAIGVEVLAQRPGKRLRRLVEHGQSGG
ncbi:MAG: hypothetical protein ACK559_26050, partial [bacterium]